MKYLLIFLLFITSCTSTKRVFICGDHECINKEDARLFFEQNLSIEVKIIQKEKEDYFNLVRLNTQNSDDKKNIRIIKRNKNKKIKKLTKNEIVERKKEIKDIKEKLKKESNNSAKRSVSNKNVKIKNLENIEKVSKERKDTIVKKKIIKDKNICNIIEKCDIDEISKYLINKGKNKDYPNISLMN